jgi:hypothetical protein
MILRYELFTGIKSEKNIQRNLKIGHKIFKTETINANLSMDYLEKRKL